MEVWIVNKSSLVQVNVLAPKWRQTNINNVDHNVWRHMGVTGLQS